MRSFCGRRFPGYWSLFLLFSTFVEIIALRKGPQDIPRSMLVLLIALLLMLVSAIAVVSVSDLGVDESYGSSFLAYMLGICFYGAVILLAGRPQRIVQSLSAIIACGSIITLLFVVEYQLLQPLFGREAASIIGTLIVFWSVPVEGHIMARAIDQHWFIGIAIAMMAFIMQVAIQSALTGAA